MNNDDGSDNENTNDQITTQTAHHNAEPKPSMNSTIGESMGQASDSRGAAEAMIGRSKNETPVECPICSKQLKSTQTLKKHMANEHSAKKEIFKCDLCDYKTPKNGLLRRHKKVHIGEQTKKCTHCSAIFKTSIMLETHIFNEHTIDFSGTTCSHCSKVYPTKASFRQHIKLSHPETLPGYVADRQFECYICRKPSSSEMRLRQHLYTHNQSKKFLCAQCGYTTHNSHLYQTHMLRKDHNPAQDNKQFKCDVCGKAFGAKKILANHKTVHTRERLFQCSICDMRFLTKSNLFIHNYTHGERKYACTYCDKKFRSPVVLKKHIRTHANVVADDPVERPYQCDLCGKRFKHRKDVKEHADVHQPPKHECSYCGIKVRRMHNLRAHMKIHTRGNENELRTSGTEITLSQ